MRHFYFFLTVFALSILLFISKGFSSSFLLTYNEEDLIREKNKTEIKLFSDNNLPKYAVYFDLLGTGGILSINGDVVLFRKESLFINAKAGLGSFLLGIVFPAGLSVNFGRQNNYLETGFYLMPYTIMGLFGSAPEQNIAFSPIIGFKHFAFKSFYFRAYISPLFIPSNQTFFPIGGLSFGYSF